MDYHNFVLTLPKIIVEQCKYNTYSVIFNTFL